MPFSKKSKTLARVTFFLSFSSMKKNKKLNLLVIGVLAFSFLNIMFFESIVNGMSDAINDQLIDLMFGHVVIDPAEDHRYIDDWPKIRNKLLAFPEVDSVSPELYSTAEVRKRDKFRQCAINGVDPRLVRKVKRLHDKVVAGSFLEEGDDDEVVLGSDVAGGRYEKDSILPGTRIGADLNDKVVLWFPNGVVKEFRVKGIIRTKFLGLDIQAWIPLKTLESIINVSDKASQINVRIHDKALASSLVPMIINSGFKDKVSSWEDNAGFSRSVTKSLGMVSDITKFIGVLTAFATVFIVIYIKTRNQRGQIATQRAVGISDSAIMGSYIFEAVILGVIGIVIGFLIMRLLIVFFISHPIALPIGEVVPSLTARNQWNAALLLLASTLFAGFYPTRSILKENIIEAIRGGAM